jgi:peptidoglycan hydrolase-like protein with peptidoglycan-binding domain
MAAGIVLTMALVTSSPALAATKPTGAQGGSGGSGLITGASTSTSVTSKKPKPKPKLTAHRVSTAKKASVKHPSKRPHASIPQVAQNGGSAHLGQRTLRMGMKGHDVRVLQGYLTTAGFTTTVDGDFGPATKSNVVSFEAANSLIADGVVTYHDQAVLREVVARIQNTSTGTGTANDPSATSSASTPGKATINPNGTATAPAGAPAIVREIIAAGNQIIDKPYIYGGGHGSFSDSGYDCSGAVSYALHGANLLSSPEDSTQLETFGLAGVGTWVSVYADSGHAFLVVAGIAFDTADYGGPNIPSGTGPRWRSSPTGNLADGGSYVVRHPAGM